MRSANDVTVEFPAGRRLDTREAAQYLSISASTLTKLRLEGKGPRYLRVFSRVFYRQSDLESFLRDCEVETADSRRMSK